MIQYIVQPGDSLYTIGLRFKTSVTALMQANSITNPNMIYPGQLLMIPLPSSNIIRTGSFPIIQKGSSGPFVLLLQSQLARLGYYKGSMDGIFDSATEDSVIRFQLSRNIHPGGLVDADTWKCLLNHVREYENAPPYQADMLLSGLFVLLSADKPVYRPGETITITLRKINLAGKTIELNYNTSQRYDFEVRYSSGRTLWRWSDDKSFTQVLGTVSIRPGQVIRYSEQFILPANIKGGYYHVLGWNTAKQIEHIKFQVSVLSPIVPLNQPPPQS
ncbi:MAG: BsuPI-related putative proteinase inhibitor [Caldicoprobacterales bacterium]|nr:LysM peptidoglycan-binding domain-containing protein [Clostridiales bacterium]